MVAAVDFARNHRLRLVVKGGGHSYQDRSCSPDSLLVWTREMRDIALHDSESDFFQRDWQTAFWGANYPRLAAAKHRYDPEGLFFIHHGVGSEAWSADGFTPKTGR